MKTFSERLNAAMEAAGYSQERLAKAVGLTQPAIQKMTSGKTKGSRRSVSIAKVLGVRPEWLVEGSGSMRENLSAPGSSRESTIPPESEWEKVDALECNTLLPGNEVEVPFLRDIEFAAGDGSLSEKDYNGFKLRFLKSTLCQVGANTDGSGVICFPAMGNSMDPVIPNGATVAVDLNNKKIIDGEIYAINQGGLKRLRQLYRRPGGKIQIRSFNRNENPDEEALENDVEIIGYVFWYSVIRYRR